MQDTLNPQWTEHNVYSLYVDIANVQEDNDIIQVVLPLALNLTIW